MKYKKNKCLKQSLSYLQFVYRRFGTFFHNINNNNYDEN